MAPAQPFSKRHGFRGDPKEITVRKDAAIKLRFFRAANGPRPRAASRFVASTYMPGASRPPDEENYRDDRIWTEDRGLMITCPWFKVYDIIEEIYSGFAASHEHSGEETASFFADEVNDFFAEEGIDWQLINGQILTRGSEAFETLVAEAVSELEAFERPTAATHLHEALQDLSRRPEADLSGAAYHAMGALECVARDLSGDAEATLGETLKRHPGLLPKPLDNALSQVWGYASN